MVVPTLNARLHEVLGHVPVDRNERNVIERASLRVREQIGTPRCILFACRLCDQAVVARIVPAHVIASVVARQHIRSEEHTSELQSLMRISYAVFCLKKNT